MNVSSTFQEFLQNLVIDNKEEISDRYGEITKVLNVKYRNTESNTSNSLQVGSYGRFTAIKSISDLDMVYILPWTEYERFKNGRQSALLQEVKKTIQSRYPKTYMRGDGQVVVISFANYQIEVLPTFEYEWNSLKTTFYANKTVNGTINGGLSGTIKEIYDYINTNQASSAVEIGNNLNIPLRTLQRWLKELKEKDIIEYRGSKKTGGYFIKSMEVKL